MTDVYVPATRLRRPSWRDTRLLVGVGIVLTSVAIGARVVAAADDTVPVYAAAGTLASGHPLGAADVRVVRVQLGAGTAAYLSATLRLPPGLVVTRAVGEGELVPRSAVEAAADLTRRPVPIPVPAPLPEALRPGVVVDVWSSAKDPTSGSSGYRSPVRIAEQAEVYAVSGAGAGLAAAQAGAVQVLLEESELRAVLDALANGAKLAVLPAPGTSPDQVGRPVDAAPRPGSAGSAGRDCRVGGVSLPVLTAVTGGWEAPLVAGLERSPGEVRVVRRCVDLAELLSAAAAGLGRAAVLSGDLHRLDREAVAQLALAGVAVVGLRDPGDAAAKGRLNAIGIAHVLPADCPPEQVAAAVAAAVQELPALRPEPGRRRSDPAIGDPADALAPRTRSQQPAAPAPPGRAGAPLGTLLAVWGPTGAPGRTTVALNLAAELAALGAGVLLVDADTYGPSVAQALGLLDESGGIAGAARSANQGGLSVERLARLAPAVMPRLRVLTGLPTPSRWPELRPSALEVLWERARELAAWTVVDCGFSLEVDEELSFDTSAPRRNGATLSALAAADQVIVVGTADPVGLQRLVRGLADLTDALGPAARPRVLVTRVRSAAVGPGPDRRVADALARYAGVVDPLLVPDDRAGCDAAMLAGRSLTELVPSSPVRQVLARFAAELEAEASDRGRAAMAARPGALRAAGGRPALP